MGSSSTLARKSNQEPSKIAWQANPGPQSEALIRGEFEILFGGARGGGKTECGIVWLAEPHYLKHPRYRFLVLRQNGKDLADWVDRARSLYAPMGGVITGNPPVVHFPSGAMGRLGHLQDKNAFSHYLGHSYHKVLIEELTLIPSEELYESVLSCARTVIPELQPQIFCTTNPGNVGHVWVKNRFVSHGNMKPYQDPVTKRWRIFIRSLVEDNPVLMVNDPGYVLYLEGLKDEKKRKAWRWGDWDTFEGQFFDTWDDRLHVYDPFPIPKDWPRFRMMDWGYSDHFVCLWGAVGPYYLKNGYRLDNHVYIYREFYRNRLTDSEYAESIASLSKYPDGKDERIEYTVGDPNSFWAKIPGDNLLVKGKPYFERWETFGLNGIPIIKGDNARPQGWSRVREYLQPRQFEGELVPWLHISRDCPNLIRTLPALVHDDIRVEDVADGMEDHAPDALRYGLQSRTPEFFNKPKRYRTNFEAAEAQAKREAGERKVDRWI